MSEPSQVVVIAGPNGAGKSTTAPALLRDTLGIQTFVNADVIAQGLSLFDPERAAVAAARIMLARIHELAEQGGDFAFETTLASRSFAPWLRRLKEERGYHVALFFLWLPSPEHAIARVRERVTRGGHDVPEPVIRRRYFRGLKNFFSYYEPITDRWYFIDNSLPSTARTIAFRESSGKLNIIDSETWNLIGSQISD